MDYDQLRRDLIDHYGTGMTSGLSMAVIDLIDVQNASDVELEVLAERAGFDLTRYEDD